MTAGLGDHLEPHLEAGVGLDADLLDEGAVVGLERVGGVAGADPGDVEERQPGEPRHQRLQERAAHLLAALHVARRGGDHHAPLDQVGEVVDLLGVVAAVGHGHDDDLGRGVVDAVAQRAGRVRGP